MTFMYHISSRARRSFQTMKVEHIDRVADPGVLQKLRIILVLFHSE